jgi:hypothetical protein
MANEQVLPRCYRNGSGECNPTPVPDKIMYLIWDCVLLYSQLEPIAIGWLPPPHIDKPTPNIGYYFLWKTTESKIVIL